MPVEITLPLTKLEQAVADARANEQVMAAKVEDAKLVLKSAKTAWEEAVGEVFRAVDEMIADKRQLLRQPSLFDERATGEHEPASTTTTATATVSEPTDSPAVATASVDATAPEFVTVELLSPPTVLSANFPDLQPLAANTLPAGPSWRSLAVTELDGPSSLFDALELFGVTTLGGLADALRDGLTFNLPTQQIHDLYEAIEDVSQEDEQPIRFDRERGVAVTVKEEVKATGEEKESDPAAEEWERNLDKAEAAKVPATTATAAGGEEKPAKKKRGRKPKGEVTAEVAKLLEATPAEKPAEPEVSPNFDDL